MKKGKKRDSHNENLPNNEVNYDNKKNFNDKENIIQNSNDVIMNNDSEIFISKKDKNNIIINFDNNASMKNDNTKSILIPINDEKTKYAIKKSFGDNFVPGNVVKIKFDNKDENESGANDSYNLDPIKAFFYGALITIVGGASIYGLLLLLL